MKTIATLLTIASTLLISCTQTKPNTDTETTTNTQASNIISLKVYVNAAGIITANGQITTLPDLEKQMQALKTKNGIVFYSRDNQQADPPQQSIQVMDMVVKYSLPVQFYADSTFTKIVEFK